MDTTNQSSKNKPKYNSFTSKHYGPLNPSKWIYQPDRIEKMIGGQSENIIPVTAHLVPTLRCNHHCYFCTYGEAKKNNHPFEDMPRDKLIHILEELSITGVKGIIFTGGGEPSLYPSLIDGARFCREKSLSFAMNTNGFQLDNSLIEEFLSLEPEYIRVSLNAGTAETQQLCTGVDSFYKTIQNIAKLAEIKHRLQVSTDISVGFVINLINVHDIVPLTRILCNLESELEQKGIANSILSVQFRPVSNYETSKQYNHRQLENIFRYLITRSLEDYEEFQRFMFNGEQISERILLFALNQIDNQAKAIIEDAGSNINLVYPYQKFMDISKLDHKPYQKCSALSWFLFIWPNGDVFPCVEWAGNPGFEIGNLFDSSLLEIIQNNRQIKIDEINNSILHTRCAPVCAHHEMNIMMEHIFNSGDNNAEQLIEQIKTSPPKHINFL